MGCTESTAGVGVLLIGVGHLLDLCSRMPRGFSCGQGLLFPALAAEPAVAVSASVDLAMVVHANVSSRIDYYNMLMWGLKIVWKLQLVKVSTSDFFQFSTFMIIDRLYSIIQSIASKKFL